MHARLVRSALASLTLVCSAGVVVSGCLTRPVVPGEPQTKTNFTTKIQEQAVDKVDLLFSIDNSASMGDKQDYLEAAIPDLLDRLVQPDCVDANDPTKDDGRSSLDASGNPTCPNGQQLEFPPVHDMHIGIVSSSLGPRLGDQVGNGQGGACIGSATITIGGSMVPNHNDDQAHLLSRSETPGTTPPVDNPLPDAAAGFLAWYPTSNGGATPPNAVTTIKTLETDFTDLVAGVHQYGCGIESQLENWYRFLIQPDPYDHLSLDGNKHAQWTGVDTTILKQRHDFLRPDSLVAVIVLTDENDSEIDVRSVGGQGYLFMGTNFYPPHGHAICATKPGDPSCQPCGANDNDANCTGSGGSTYTAPTDWGYDLNLRHVHMQQKYGLTPQFPVDRYVNGLTNSKVPDRNGEYPAGANNYQGTNNCVNPLFAASLPDGSGLSNPTGGFSQADEQKLCNLNVSTRPSSLIFYAHIGGVPNQLLHFDPTSAKNSLLQDADWVRILGNDPEHYDYSGIDPHMIESYQPRNMGAPGAPSFPTATPIAGETALAAANGGNTDPWNGREWVTNVGNHVDLAVDREYACIFQLNTPRDCTVADNRFACDCSSTGLSPDQLSPVCDPANPTTQKYAKAYPTVRELLLAKKLGTQGIVSSICPIHVQDNASGSDPLYGYRPAVASIINRLKNALTNQCLPQQLQPDPTQQNQVPCLILATLSTPGNQSVCTSTPGLATPDPSILAQFRATQEATWKANGGTQGGAGPDPATLPVCQVQQLIPNVDYQNGTCKGASKPGWCYVTGAAAGTCTQSILFTNGTPPTGSTISLQCIETNTAGTVGDAGSGGATTGG